MGFYNLDNSHQDNFWQADGSKQTAGGLKCFRLVPWPLWLYLKWVYEHRNMNLSAQTVDPARSHLGPCLCARVEEEHERCTPEFYWGARMYTRVQEIQLSCGFSGLAIAQIFFEFAPVLASCCQKILFAKVARGLISWVGASYNNRQSEGKLNSPVLRRHRGAWRKRALFSAFIYCYFR